MANYCEWHKHRSCRSTALWLEQPVGGGAQQTLMTSTSSGPSTFSAGQPLVPQLLQQDRTGGARIARQKGSLGTAGDVSSAVTTVEFADAHGMHGGATAVAQNLGVATVQAGMASSHVNVAAGASGHNPSAVNPGSSAEGVETPSSMVHRASVVMQSGAQAFASSWLGRVQSLFGDAASGQPTPQALAPSPLTSPPRQSLPLQPLERGGRIVQDVGQVLLFSGANAQQLAAMEQRANLLYDSPDRHPNTESSSIPHDAIPAEVARQLEGLKQRLREEQERAGRAEAELLRIQSQQAGGYAAGGC